MVGSTTATVTKVLRDDVDEMIPASVSIMPEGIAKQLGEERMRDLLTFLLTPPPSMPDYGPLEPPTPRTRGGGRSCFGRRSAGTEPRPLQVVLVAGRKIMALASMTIPPG